jgi:hypothetical protein
MCSTASIARLCDGCTTAFQVWSAAGLNEGVFAHKDIAAGLHPPGSVWEFAAVPRGQSPRCHSWLSNSQRGASSEALLKERHKAELHFCRDRTNQDGHFLVDLLRHVSTGEKGTDSDKY